MVCLRPDCSSNSHFPFCLRGVHGDDQKAFLKSNISNQASELGSPPMLPLTLPKRQPMGSVSWHFCSFFLKRCGVTPLAPTGANPGPSLKVCVSLSSLCFSLLVYKMGIIVEPTSLFVFIMQWVNTRTHLAHSKQTKYHSYFRCLQNSNDLECFRNDWTYLQTKEFWNIELGWLLEWSPSPVSHPRARPGPCRWCCRHSYNPNP